MGARRKTQQGQEDRRVFLVVVDDSEELHQALYFACCRAKRLGGRVALLYCIPPAEFQHFAGVGELMREEAREKAEDALRINSEWVHDFTGQTPVVYVREGEAGAEVTGLINEDEEISVLVLGADTTGDGSNNLIQYFTNKGVANCPIPITIVPGTLTDEDIEKLT